jgi:hypothetical protein
MKPSENLIKALVLFVITEPMKNMDAEDELFHILYDLECELFETLRKLTPEESEYYRNKVNKKRVSTNIPFSAN